MLAARFRLTQTLLSRLLTIPCPVQNQNNKYSLCCCCYCNSERSAQPVQLYGGTPKHHARHRPSRSKWLTGLDILICLWESTSASLAAPVGEVGGGSISSGCGVEFSDRQCVSWKSGWTVQAWSQAPALLSGADWSAADAAIFPRLLVPSEHFRKMILIISDCLSLPTRLAQRCVYERETWLCKDRMTCVK